MAETGNVAALVAGAFREEEYFLPKFALQRAGFHVGVVSLRGRGRNVQLLSVRPGSSTSTRRLMT